MSSLSFLSALTDCDVKVFASKYVGAILQKLWEEEIKWIFIVDFCFYAIFCFFWAALVTTTNMTRNSEKFGGEPLNDETSWMALTVFVMNLLLIFKGYRQLLSASDWYKPGSVVDHIADRVVQIEDTIKHALKQAWLVRYAQFFFICRFKVSCSRFPIVFRIRLKRCGTFSCM
jgi:hypothetical protein